MKNFRGNSRGATLVIAMALLAALAIIGATIIGMARADRFASRAFKDNAQAEIWAEGAMDWLGSQMIDYYWQKVNPDPVSYDQYTVNAAGIVTDISDNPWDTTAATAPLIAGEPTPYAWNKYGTQSHIAVVRPGIDGSLTIRSVPQNCNLPGLFWCSWGDPNDVTDLPMNIPTNRFLNLPLVYPIPDSGMATSADGAALRATPVFTPTNFNPPDMKFLELEAPPGSYHCIRMSFTVIDLCSRLNLNFHGDGADTLAGGQNVLDEGCLLTDIAPNWIEFVNGNSGGRTPLVGLEAKGTGANSFYSLLMSMPYGRWGSKGDGELGDRTINQFGNDYTGATDVGRNGTNLPFTLEEGMDLLNLCGMTNPTGGAMYKSRLLWGLPTSLGATTSAGVRTGACLYRSSLFTTHSWVSAARRNFFDRGMTGKPNYSIPLVGATPSLGWNEVPAKDLYVKADLNLAPLPDLRHALLATRAFNPSTAADLQQIDQILVNIISFRDSSGQPAGLIQTKATPNYKVFGVGRQPFINEVYAVPSGTKHQYNVYIELANPYSKALAFNTNYNKLTMGGTDVTTLLTAQFPGGIPVAGTWVPGAAGGVVVNAGTVIVGVDAQGNDLDLNTKLDPIELWAPVKYVDPDTGATLTGTLTPANVLIDRMHYKTGGGNSGVTSYQRFCSTGNNRAGTAYTFFGGYSTINEGFGPPSCLSGTTPTFAMNGVNTTGVNGQYTLIRPIENRGLNDGASPDPKNKNRYPPTGLSFRRVGDIARILRIGPQYSSDNNITGAASMAVTEILGAAGTEDACHVDIIASKNKYRRLLEVFNVNSPYYDGISNNGDGLIDSNNRAAAFTANYATGTNDADDQRRAQSLGPEIYEPGRINLKTAPAEVIRAMMPYQLTKHTDRPGLSGDPLWTMAMAIVTAAQGNGANPMLFNNPGDMLDATVGLPLNLQNAFISTDPTKRWDDDNNGAPDDYAQKTFVYGFMSNWATTRSDCFAVYGTLQFYHFNPSNGALAIDKSRHFMTILDRVPATAYPPIQYTDVTPAGSGNQKSPTLNPQAMPMRRVGFMWLD